MTKASFNQNKYSTFYYTFRLSWESFADISIKFSALETKKKNNETGS